MPRCTYIKGVLRELLAAPLIPPPSFPVIPTVVIGNPSWLFTFNNRRNMGARVEPILVTKWLLVLPGFAPANEPFLFRQKWPKPVTPRQVSLDGTDASLKRRPTRGACPESWRRAQTRSAESPERPFLEPVSRRRTLGRCVSRVL